MKIFENETYIKDIQAVSKVIPSWQELNNRVVLITGATGLICSAIVDVLQYINRTKELNIKIVLAVRNRQRAMQRFDMSKGDISIVSYDATKDINFEFSVDYIIHGAGNSSPELYVNEPVDTMLANIVGTKNLLEYARNNDVKRFLYISSSEIYGKKESFDPYSESDYGYIDLLNVRSSYPIAKRAAETLCISYKEKYNVDSVIVRPGHIYGPTASEKDARVSSAFAYQAAKGKSLIMKSEGVQRRSYCHCLDCTMAILTVLLKGKSGQAYNISNKNSIITIRQMAEITARAAKVKLKMELSSQNDRKAFNPMDNSALNSEKIESLGWYGVFEAEKGISHTIWILSELVDKKEQK